MVSNHWNYLHGDVVASLPGYSPGNVHFQPGCGFDVANVPETFGVERVEESKLGCSIIEDLLRGRSRDDNGSSLQQVRCYALLGRLIFRTTTLDSYHGVEGVWTDSIAGTRSSIVDGGISMRQVGSIDVDSGASRIRIRIRILVFVCLTVLVTRGRRGLFSCLSSCQAASQMTSSVSA